MRMRKTFLVAVTFLLLSGPLSAHANIIYNWTGNCDGIITPVRVQPPAGEQVAGLLLRDPDLNLFKRYGELRIQGVSERQAPQVLAVPRSTLQAWRGLYAAGLVIFDVIC
jgi:hypothetical protein